MMLCLPSPTVWLSVVSLGFGVSFTEIYVQTLTKTTCVTPNPETGPPILIGHFFRRFWARRRFNWTSVRPSVRPSVRRSLSAALSSPAGRSGERGSEPAALIGPKRHSAFNEMSDAKLELGSEERARGACIYQVSMGPGRIHPKVNWVMEAPAVSFHKSVPESGQ